MVEASTIAKGFGYLLATGIIITALVGLFMMTEVITRATKVQEGRLEHPTINEHSVRVMGIGAFASIFAIFGFIIYTAMTMRFEFRKKQ